MELIKIFVSYSHEDTDFAIRFSDNLSAAQIDFFMDSRIEYGEHFVKKIEEAIKQASHFVCLISKASLRSPWVQYEINLAKQYGITVIPILLESGIHLEPTFDSKIQNIRIYNHNLSDDKLWEILIKAKMFDGGIVPVGLFRKYKQCFPNEFFASELLTHPVFFRREGEKLIIRINRAGVKYVVISNEGKTHLCERFVSPKRAKLIDLDRRILDFMRAPNEHNSPEITTTDLPLRWASGGVLSIVNHNGRLWAPLFFRDVPPYGWNLSLGATERYFNSQGREIDDQDYSLEKELTYPWKFILREFLEETLVLDKEPQLCGKSKWLGFNFTPQANIEVQSNQAQRFAENNLKLRQNQDGLNILYFPQEIDITIHEPTTFRLEIIGDSHAAPSPGVWDVLVTINPVELGIEVIKVFEYDLPSEHCILDGEVYQIKNHPEIVRMPIGLLSLEYLYRNFGKPDYQLKFNEEDVHPSIEADTLKEDDIYVFRWDFDQRARVWGRNEATDWEKERYAEWSEFEAAFHNGFKGNKSAFPNIFTPATAKVINLFFNCCKRGKDIAAQFKSDK